MIVDIPAIIVVMSSAFMILSFLVSGLFSFSILVSLGFVRLPSSSSCLSALEDDGGVSRSCCLVSCVANSSGFSSVAPGVNDDRVPDCVSRRGSDTGTSLNSPVLGPGPGLTSLIANNNVNSICFSFGECFQL
eukprot:NODE_243_length_11887_cov_0.520699.p11 type:complete len:133 gc:universal NODE_243_length_11887_cov_0.520699:3326-2928(-)